MEEDNSKKRNKEKEREKGRGESKEQRQTETINQQRSNASSTNYTPIARFRSFTTALFMSSFSWDVVGVGWLLATDVSDQPYQSQIPT